MLPVSGQGKDNGDNPKARTLRRAVEAVGNPQALAEALGVSPEMVSAWLLGQQALPNDVYMRALDLVSQGPHHRSPRKPK
jgi:transcriptional regulator with XRE-family HTH domain